ncbi:hypothetical protein ACROYT_G008328 [Oculina patagonica]
MVIGDWVQAWCALGCKYLFSKRQAITKEGTQRLQIGDSIDIAIAQLNKTLKDVYTWCLTNRLTPHPGKSEVMLLSKGTLTGPHAPIQLGTSILRCITKTRLLGMTVDRNLSWWLINDDDDDDDDKEDDNDDDDDDDDDNERDTI